MMPQSERFPVLVRVGVKREPRQLYAKARYTTVEELMKHFTVTEQKAWSKGELELRDCRKRKLELRHLYNWAARQPLTLAPPKDVT